MPLLLIIAILIFLIFLNALYVAAEFSAVSTRKARLSQFVSEGNKLASSMLEIVEDPHKLDAYIATCQLGITVSSLMLGFFGQSQLSEYIAPLFANLGSLSNAAAQSVSATVILLWLTIFQVVLGELVPKNIGIQYPERLVMVTYRPMRWSMAIFRPLIWFVNGSGQLLMKLFGQEVIAEYAHIHSPKEIVMLVEDYSKGLQHQERQLLKNTLQLRESKVREVMIPRTQMFAQPINLSCDTLLQKISLSRYSRMPLYNGTIDNIEGVVHLKDLLCLTVRNNITPIVRQVPFVPETTSVKGVFSILQRRHLQVAIVLDEFGGTAGMVTLEDLVEEIFGELQDEYDDKYIPNIRELPENRLRIRGDVLIMDLNEILEINLPDKDVDTIGGLVLNQFREAPSEKDKVHIEGIPFTVSKMEGRGVSVVIMECTSEQIQLFQQERGQS